MNPDEINSARSALLQVAERLRQQATANQVENASRHNQSHQTQPGVSQSTTVQPDANNPPRLSSSTAVGNAQVNEHRKLFGYAARGKQPKKGKSFAKQKVQTCSLKFVCLASRSAVKPPTTIKERTMLANACLGDGTVTFHVDGNSSHLHEKLLEAFPKLFSAGYELFLFDRSGENSSFCHLKPPYLPKKLKEVAGQCKIYIKPLQKELLDSNDNEDIEDDVGPLISCIVCETMVPMNLIDDHHQSIHDGQPKHKKKRAEPCIYNMLQKGDGGECSRSYEIKDALHDLVPTASHDEIDSALSNACGNADEAAEQLLALQDDENADDLEISTSTSLIMEKLSGNDQMDNSDETNRTLTLEDFRRDNVDESLSRQRFTVSIENGLDELKKDILGCYKSPQVKLRAKLRVKFEGEGGVGSGPVREFLLCAMKIVEDGVEKGGKPLLFFEGEEDHKAPIHDQALRCTGAFRAIGRIIGHSILHEGPVIYGLSPAVVQYWRVTANGIDDDSSLESLPLSMHDIPDIDLRGYINELENLPLDEVTPVELKDAIAPYIFESGLDIDMLYRNRNLIIQGLVIYNVIHKRKRELDDIARGMNEVKLHAFIGECLPETLEVIFPISGKRRIAAEHVKDAVTFEESVGHEDTIMLFYQYLCDLEKYETGKPSITDLCCFWTATNNLPPRKSDLLVKFDDSQNLFPFAETCFMSMVLPTVHKSYEDFKKHMDIALNHGSMGLHHS